MVQASLLQCLSLRYLLPTFVGWLFVMDADIWKSPTAAEEETQLTHSLLSAIASEKSVFSEAEQSCLGECSPDEKSFLIGGAEPP
jgi:hypothetical protein